MDFASALNKLKRSADNVQREQEGKSSKKRFRDGNHSNGLSFRESEEISSLRRKLESLKEEGDVNQGIDGAKDDLGCNHVALLFITIGDLPHEEIWKAFFDDKACDGLNVSVLVHAKFPNKIRSPWLRRYLLPRKSHRPEWGSIEITRAMIDLVEEGLRGNNRFLVKSAPDSEKDTKSNPPNVSRKSTPDRFIFVSESCLPICTLKTLHKALKQESSWLDAINEPNNGYS